MIFSEPLSQYEEILKDAIRTSMKESAAKLAKTFQPLLIAILTLYMILPRKINFTQMARYGKHGEQTYRHCHRPMLYQQDKSGCKEPAFEDGCGASNGGKSSKRTVISNDFSIIHQ